jgi:hypothetical protein
VLICIVGLFPGVGNAADRNGCSNTIDNPHYSSGALGVIAKGHWSCTVAPATIYLSGERGFFLWLCPTQPPKDETWITSHCNQKGRNGTDFTISQANTDYVRYVPPSGQPGGTGTGWWIACSMWQSARPFHRKPSFRPHTPRGRDKTTVKAALVLLWASQHLDNLWRLEAHLEARANAVLRTRL